MKVTRKRVYSAIDGERDYQDRHTLANPIDPGFSTGDYITMLTCYADKLPAAWALNPGEAPPEVLHNMRKIAAIAIQCLEAHGVLPREIEGIGQWGQASAQARIDAKTTHMRGDKS